MTSLLPNSPPSSRRSARRPRPASWLRAGARRLWRELVRDRGRGHPFYRSRARRGRRSESGVALVVVLAAIMIMTVVVTDMNYGARVRLLSAAHERDETHAYWLARSGVNLYRLILTANYQMKNNSYLGQLSEAYGVNIGDALWQAVPFMSTGLMRMLFVSGGSVDDLEEEEVQEVARTGTVDEEVGEASREMGRFDDEYFLDFEGDFMAEIEDVDSKINVNNFSRLSSTDNILEDSTALQIYGLMSGQENDQWFYERDLDRWELIGNLADWVDQDNTRCGKFSGYEDDLYNRLESPYLAKNAAFDTKEEIRLVDGWQDEVYERYADDLTVWGSGKVNINTASREILFGLLKSFLVSTPSDDFAWQLVDLVETYKTITSFQNGSDFVDYLQNQGVEVSDEMKDVVATSSSVFRVTSTGVVGDTNLTITAVLDYSSSSEGEVLYWRED